MIKNYQQCQQHKIKKDAIEILIYIVTQFVQGTILDQGPPCFGHLAKSPFLVNVMVLAKLNFQDDLDKYIN